MGTNYYAHWTPPGAQNVTIRLHICKSLVMFNGQVFPTWTAWKDFLTHGTKFETLTIVDEHGKEHELGEFVRGVESTSRESRRRQYDFEVHDPDIDTTHSWLDPYFFSFHNGEFS
ncbi:hypothetical protein [Microbacterium lacus]|uniref:hypothetical protein n=1 Tax=Microbacterium lacus TaxID=415217 RepID=UPI000C2B9619|nr:hypothetical protein [Microbacterium lacus]